MAVSVCTKEKKKLPAVRTRKAWRITVEGWDNAGVYFAHTAGKACGAIFNPPLCEQVTP
ncbi:hypothetical protein NBRC3299_0254 [Acetobacter pasteurianus NBRC 3299]|nr:hypothetical protein NBRC3299_0254 [Acetobacter pasteurianus NBRC 3299]